jgi:hypothetical protein
MDKDAWQIPNHKAVAEQPPIRADQAPSKVIVPNNARTRRLLPASPIETSLHTKPFSMLALPSLAFCS